jgi:hypothetical protein
MNVGHIWCMDQAKQRLALQRGAAELQITVATKVGCLGMQHDAAELQTK